MNSEQLRGIVWASFLADSLALGAHWIYDQKKMVQKFTRVDTLLAPWSGSQHAGKWHEFWIHAASYVDQGTKKTLANLQEGKDLVDAGSQSNDLAGAARIAPLIYLLADDLQDLVQASRDQPASEKSAFICRSLFFVPPKPSLKNSTKPQQGGEPGDQPCRLRM